jgi:2,4-dienoyl-CoA reductase-like NADH-dependent reductase (Old Yellow Enzyme family)
MTVSRVFEGSSLAGIPLKNRIIRSATFESLGDAEGRPGEELSRLYQRLARGEVGAIITGLMGVVDPASENPRTLMLHQRSLVPLYQKILESVKPWGTPVIAQLYHAGGKVHPAAGAPKVLAPSRRRFPPWGVLARSASRGDIEKMVEQFVRAVTLAREAGFAGVQLHAAHGYFLAQFLSPRLNRRRDEWGGTTEGRFRILGEIVRRARDAVGRYPILLKLSAYDAEPKGMRLPEAVKIARLAEASGVDAIEVSSGGINFFESIRAHRVPAEAVMALDPYFRKYPASVKKGLAALLPHVIKSPSPLHNYNVQAAAEIKSHLRIPVIVVGGLRRLKDLEQVLADKKADYVALSRPLIIEPDLVKKFHTGSQQESRCINCNYCLLSLLRDSLRCYYGKLS